MKHSHKGKRKKCKCHHKRRKNSWTRYIRKNSSIVVGKPCEDRLKILGKKYQKRKAGLRRSKRIRTR